MREQILAVVASWLLTVQPTITAPDPVERAFPVRGDADYSSAHHDYPATDVFAACGSRAQSPVDGVVLELGRRDRWQPESNLGAARGGRFVSIRGDDGVRYYLSHFARVREGIRVGDRVAAGTPIGRVGRSGSARETPCHVHFGLSPACRGHDDWDVRRGVVSPFRFLRSWEAGGDRSPRRAVADWTERHGCG